MDISLFYAVLYRKHAVVSDVSGVGEFRPPQRGHAIREKRGGVSWLNYSDSLSPTTFWLTNQIVSCSGQQQLQDQSYMCCFLSSECNVMSWLRQHVKGKFY